jgi:lipopolysaccharide assembly outer membrane protein LptD (OstA)
MKVRAAWRAGGRALCLAAAIAIGASRAAGAAEVRVLSGPGAATTVTIGTVPTVRIEDRTPGAKPSTATTGPASSGETFTEELTVFLGGFAISRSASIEVDDPVVSAVRLFPEADGTTATIFVRQPVTYSVSRASPLGEVRIELHGKTRPLTVTLSGTRQQPRAVPPKPTGERETAVDAESLSYDQATNTLIAHGGVMVRREDTTLTADEVVYDRTNGIVEARGHVVLTEPQATVHGDFAHLDLEDETGWIENTDATLEVSRYQVQADRIDKEGGPQYSIARGIFTTCECGGLEKPSWSIAGRTTDVNVQGTGRVHDMTFRVKDIPVLYFPYMIFPANNQRQTGLLIPRVGYSNRRGFQYEQPFFWAINKSMDATFAVDVETEARIGGTAEFRYILSRLAHGAFTAGYWNESIRGRPLGIRAANGEPADIPENRFAIAGHHVSPFYGKSKLYLDMLAVSDDFLLKEINTFAFSTRDDLALRSTRYTTSKAGIYKGWGEGFANGETAYYQDLIDPQEVALQKLPRIDAEHSAGFLGDHVVARVGGQAIDYQREDGFGGLRGDLAPDLFLPFHLGRVLNGSVTGQLRETAYHLTDDNQVAFSDPDAGSGLVGAVLAPSQLHDGRTGAPLFPRLDDNQTRELATVNGRLGTEIARVFGFHHLGFDKLRHTIEPEVQYLFVPQVSNLVRDQVRVRQSGNQLFTGCSENPLDPNHCNETLLTSGYLFDERDAINRRNFVSYGLTSRLLARAAPAAAPPPPPAEGEAPEHPAEGAPRVDPDTIAQGLSVDAIPAFVGPPPPPDLKGAVQTPPRELARASILHGYDISRTLVGNSHQSDIDLGIRLTPLDYLGISYNTTVSAEQAKLRGMSVGVFGREPSWTPERIVGNYQSPTTVGISYRFIDQNVNRDVGPGSDAFALQRTEGVNEVDGSVYVRLGKYIGFNFLSRFSFNDAALVDKNGAVITDKNGAPEVIGAHFLERDYLVRLISRCNCWVIEAGVADKFNPDERLFRVQFTLVGLGQFGQSPLNRNYVGLTPLNQLGYRRPGIGPGTGGIF